MFLLVGLFRCVQRRDTVLGSSGENVLSEDVTRACWHCSSLGDACLAGDRAAWLNRMNCYHTGGNAEA